jgi:hypothetical protein
VSLASSVNWNLCLHEGERTSAGLEDECWFASGQTVEKRVSQTFHFSLPAGEWYVAINGDYYNILRGRLFDANNATSVRELTASPTWDTCEVRLRTFQLSFCVHLVHMCLASTLFENSAHR